MFFVPESISNQIKKFEFLEQHEKRIRELKDLLPVIELENWRYPSVDELLGLTSS